MRHVLLVLALPLAVACARVDVPIALSVSAVGVEALNARVDRGDLVVLGDETDTLALTGTSTGYGSSAAQASAREAGNTVTLAVDGATARLTATSTAKRAWTALDVVGPTVLDLDVDVRRGSVHVEAVAGEHVIRADRITARRLEGTAELRASSGGMDVDLRPDAGGRVQIESSAGDVVLRLPWGLPYDIEVIGDPGYGMYIEELGFHATFSEPGYFAGTVGDGSIQVAVFVNGGSFQLLEAL